MNKLNPLTYSLELYRYSIGNTDLRNGLEYGWLYTLSRINRKPYTQKFIRGENNTISGIELLNGPDRKTRYLNILVCICIRNSNNTTLNLRIMS